MTEPASSEGAAAAALENERALLREAVRRQRILSEVSRILLDYTGDDEVEPLRRVVDKMVEAFGDWCSFGLIQGDGTLKTVVAYHPDARQRELVDRVAALLPPARWDAPPVETNALVQRRPIFFEQVTDQMLRASIPDDAAFELFKQIGLTSLITSPMFVGTEPIGTFTLASTGAGGRIYTANDIDFVFTMAGRAALAIRNARLVRALSYERSQAEQRAAELLSVLESDPNGIAIFGPDDKLRFASRSLDALLGHAFSLHIGRRHTELFADPSVPASQGDPAERALRLAELFADRSRVDREHIRISGRDVLRISAPVTAATDAYGGRIFVFVDVTRERELDRKRAEFLTVAAHELRTPLTPLSMYLQTIERRLTREQAPSPELLRKAQRQVLRLEKLVQDLLDVSRIESGRLLLRRESFALDAMAAEVVADFRDSARQHELVFHRPEEPVQIDGDRERLEQVLINLLQNAIKYSPHGGRIEVTVDREGDSAHVSVKDPGIGIPKEEQALLFERFFRAKNAAASNYGGLGIGLFVSHQIIERHGGRFEVESDVGRGTTVRFSLPVVASAPEAGPKPRILLVDDDPDILEATAGFLRDEGFAVEQARDGNAGLELLRRAPPDLVLLDLMMPGLDGKAFVQRLRQEKLAPGVPVVVFSAAGDVRQKAQQIGADEALHKPFSLDELLELVQRMVRREPATG